MSDAAPPVAEPIKRRRAKAKKRRVLKGQIVAKAPVTSYLPEHAELARRCCAYLGATAEELANVIGIGRSTLYVWAQKHPDLKAALEKGKLEADAIVAERLFTKAKGWETDAVEIFLVEEITTTEDPQTGAKTIVKTKKPLYAPYRKREAPDTMAGMYWLNNRRPNDWHRRDDRGQGDGAPAGDTTINNLQVNIETLNAEQRAQLRQLLQIALPAPDRSAAEGAGQG